MDLSNSIQQLAAQLGASLANNKLRITTAESCTGGGICYAMTDTPGSSQYIDRCYITYSNQSKTEMLGVSEHTVQKHGAVSEQTVREMVTGAAIAADAEVAIAVSGIAGPEGGSDDKPVGTVWFGFKVLDTVTVEQCIFAGDRAKVREQAIEFALKNTIALVNSKKSA